MTKLRTILLLFTLCLVRQGLAMDTVTWATESFEPYYIANGALANQGIGDRLNAALIAALPQYQHAIRYMPILRITEALQRGEKVAVTTYLKNPSDREFAQYSITSLVVPPLELTLRKTDWIEKWGGSDTISLREFMDRGHVVGIAGRRYYGDNLSPLLYHERPRDEAVYVVQSTHFRSLAEMVARGRIDATVGYVAELKYYQHGDPRGEELVSVPIKENPDILYAYVVMPKTEWGSAFKRDVDDVLKRIRNTDAYKAILYDWFGRDPRFVKAVEARFASDD